MYCVRQDRLGVASAGRRIKRLAHESVTLTSRGEVHILPRVQLQERQEEASASASPSRREELRFLLASDTGNLAERAFLSELHFPLPRPILLKKQGL